MKKNNLESLPEPAKRLCNLLKSHNMKQKDLAKKIHVDARYVSLLCCGDRGLSMDMAKRIAEQFPGTRPQWLLGLDDYQTEEEHALSVNQFHNTVESLTDDLIRSHGYELIRSRQDNQDLVTIVSPSGERKTVLALQFLRLIDSINDHIEGQLLLGFHKLTCDKQYSGRCW